MLQDEYASSFPGRNRVVTAHASKMWNDSDAIQIVPVGRSVRKSEPERSIRTRRRMFHLVIHRMFHRMFHRVIHRMFHRMFHRVIHRMFHRVFCAATSSRASCAYAAKTLSCLTPRRACLQRNSL